jgi:hypothetical protein
VARGSPSRIANATYAASYVVNPYRIDAAVPGRITATGSLSFSAVRSNEKVLPERYLLRLK